MNKNYKLILNKTPTELAQVAHVTHVWQSTIAYYMFHLAWSQ